MPTGIAIDKQGNIYVSDGGATDIRKISNAGVVTVYAGTDMHNGGLFFIPWGVAVDGSGNVYATDVGSNSVNKISPSGPVVLIANLNSGFSQPLGITVDAANNVYVADAVNNKIKKIAANGEITTIAGDGSFGSSNGPGSTASFSHPDDVAIDAGGNIFVADFYGNKIRKITPDGVVSTIAGSGAIGSTDGTGISATFFEPAGIAVDKSGNLYVTDSGNNMVRKITPNGTVSTLAGNRTQGSTDGTGKAASFNSPTGITVDDNYNIYVADSGNNLIRKIIAKQ